MKRLSLLLTGIGLLFAQSLSAADHSRPNVVLVMTDDQGWGQMGYYDHPALKTPNLDAMARNGLRLDRFYAGASNCSPTRATVMTGRTNDRTGVENHGFPLRLQEKTLPSAMQKAGYATGHFGKWHLNGLRGPGAPILKSDTHGPEAFGFDEWVSVTNFFDRDPLMSRMGKFEEFEGDSSEIVVGEALKFIERQRKTGKPFFVVVWFGTPHSPFVAADEDMKAFADLDESSRNHYGEMVAMDRSIGTLRKGLRQLETEQNTLFWFNSDNGGLPKITPETVGGLRGFKSSIYEGGIRVPCIIEWPDIIKPGRISKYPVATLDIFPTVADIVGLPDSSMLQPIDGQSVKALFHEDLERRSKPIGFRRAGSGAFIDNDYKLLNLKLPGKKYELYNLAKDQEETVDLIKAEPKLAAKMIKQFEKWNATVDRSVGGKDYPEGHVLPNQPERRFWNTSEEYAPYLEAWKNRPEYQRSLKK
ncbi:sulfatase-like hydrolase/transferase [Verrucomicrobia bacterium]|nr:sulfatase-like hydrolase/transferase [Verrucomicrobiota bacterium]